jgi:hypothetical protein
MIHMTDEQLAEWLAGEAKSETLAHIEGCPQCRAEAFEVRDGISRYSVAMRRQASGAHQAMGGDIAQRRSWAQPRLRWAGAAALTLLLAGSTAWLMESRPALPGAHVSSQPAAASKSATASPANQAARQSADQSANQLSDDELLEAVNNDLSREVPLALAPVSAITMARNQIAVRSSSEANNKALRK